MALVRPPSTVHSALRASDNGVPDAINAAAHDVSVKTIRRWRRDYQRRGRTRGQAHTSVPCPRCQHAALDHNAYSELLGWYLGDGYISRGRRDVYNLHIYNDERYSATNLRIIQLLSAVKPGGKPHTRKLPGCLAITVSWKHWPCLFPQHGPGRKHERPIRLEAWQEAIVSAYPGALLRGLFHSDGCRVRNWSTRAVAGERRRYNYPRWMFVNRSDDIIGLCIGALDSVGIAWRRPRANCIAVSRAADVARLDALIGQKE